MLDRQQTLNWLLHSGVDRYYEKDGRYFDRLEFKWVQPEEREVWPPRKTGETLLDNKIIDLRSGSGFRSKDSEDYRRKKKKQRRAEALAKRPQVQHIPDWRSKYDPNGPAELKRIYEDQLTKFINRHSRDMAEAIVAAGWSPEDILTMMFDKHGKMFDLDRIER